MGLQRVGQDWATFTSLLQKSVLTQHRDSVTICWMNEWITKAKKKKAQTPLYSHLPTPTITQDNGFRCRPLIFLPPNPCAQMLSYVRLFVTPWTVACQAHLSTGFYKQEHTGVGCHFLLQGFSQHRDKTHISCIGRWIFFFYYEPPGKLLNPWPQSVSCTPTPFIFTCFDPAPIQTYNLHWLFPTGTLSSPFCTYSRLWISAATLDTTFLVLYF